MYDVIVVGARCAGATTAMRLAERGHRVLCVDRVTFPRDTISTHYLRQVGLAKLRDFGLLEKLEATDCPPIDRITISYLDISFTGFSDPIDGITRTYAPRRVVLDGLLQDAARAAGVEIREGLTLVDLLRAGERVTGVVCRDQDGSVVEMTARLVIGADGRNSTVANLVGAPFYDVVPALTFNYYSYWADLDVHCQSRIGRGQMVGAWPTNGAMTIVWTVQPVARFTEFRTDVEGNFERALTGTAPDLAEAVAAGSRAEKFYGIRYPDNFYRVSHGPGWALVGDAGYHKDPFTGTGISDAFIHADLLANHAHAGLSGDAPLTEALAEYQRRRDADSAPQYRHTCEAARMRMPERTVEVMRALRSSPEHLRQWFRMMGGGLSGDDFYAEDNVRALLGSAA